MFYEILPLYNNLAQGFGTNMGVADNGGDDIADLAASSGHNGLYTDLAIARLYGDNYSEEVSGFDVVNVNVDQGVNAKGPDPINYQLNYVVGWNGSS